VLPYYARGVGHEEPPRLAASMYIYLTCTYFCMLDREIGVQIRLRQRPSSPGIRVSKTRPDGAEVGVKRVDQLTKIHWISK
jgi:hypothetical protein